jgi:hypothetical protein
MSFDYISTRQVCDHQILLERYGVDANDFRTLRSVADPSVSVRGPINGASMVRVYVGGKLVTANDPTYGYDIVRSPNRIDQNVAAIFYDIVLRRPARWGSSLLVEVSYITQQPFCLKCGGRGSNNDWKISPTKTLERVYGVAKMAQQCMKYLLTSINPFNPNLTCAIRTYIGKKLGVGITDEDIAAEATRALNSYKQIQSSQQTVQTLTPEEVLKDIVDVATREDPDDPTSVYLTVQVQGYGGSKPVPLNVALQNESTT